jgi:glucose/arabinose dehydrogenase
LLVNVSCEESNRKDVSNSAQVDLSAEAKEIEATYTRGKFLYENYCSGCHGAQMQAFVDRKWLHGNSPDELRKSIIHGYTEAGMPAWGAQLKPRQIDALVAYIGKGIKEVETYSFEEETFQLSALQTEMQDFTLDTLFSGIEVPWDIEWLPNGDLLVTERSGALYRVDQSGNSTKIKGVPPVRVKNQDGLFEVLLHPNFKENNYLYLSYATLQNENGEEVTSTRVTRYNFSNDRLSNPLDLFTATPFTQKQYHFGGRMAFDEDGYLFITVGDRGERDVNPQDLSRAAGAIHRIHDDGRIPKDNPFVGRENAVASIYSYGHRNPQGLAIHPETGAIWEHEHGPRGGDEINIIEPGKNYGWPVISYGINYDGTSFTNKVEQKGMVQPKHYWTPSIAPSGMTFVTSNKYPSWKGNILVGSLRFEYLNRVVLDGDQVEKEEILFKNIGRVREVEQGPDGFIYILVEKPGMVLRLIPNDKTA